MFWVPLAVLLLWSTAYVTACINWASAPGKPMLLELPTRGGTITLHAQSYSLDLAVGVLFARDVRLDDPNGVALASAKQLRVKLPAILGGSEPMLTVNSEGAEFFLDRGANGEIRILKYLPEETEERSKIPYRVDLRQSVVRLSDRAGTNEWRKALWSEKVVVDGVGDSIVATGDFRAAGQGGAFQGTLRSDPASGYSLAANLDNLELSDALRNMGSGPEGRKWPALRNFGSKSIRATGKLNGTLSPEGQLRLVSDLSAQGEAIRYGSEFLADSATFRGRATDRGAFGMGEVLLDGMRVAYDGSATWAKEFEGLANIEAKAPSLARSPAWLRRGLPKRLSAENATYVGWVRWKEDTGLILSGIAGASKARFRNEAFETPKVALSVGGGRLVADIRGGAWDGHAATGLISVDLASGKMHGIAKSSSVDLASLGKRFGWSGITGKADVSAVLAGTGSRPEIQIRAFGEARLALKGRKPTPLGKFQVLAVGDGDHFRVPRFVLSGSAGTAVGTGTFTLGTGLIRGDVYVRGFDLTSADSDLQGTAAAALHLSGTVSEPQVFGTAELFGVKLSGQEAPLIVARGGLNRRRLSVEQVTVRRGAAIAEGTFDWAFETGAIAGDFKADGLQLSNLVRGEIAGSFDLSEGHVSGTLAKPVVTALAKGQDLAAQGIKIDSVEGIMSLREGILTAENLIARSGGGEVAGSARFDLEKKSGEATGKATGLSLLDILPSLPGETVLAGKVGSDFTLGFTEAGLQSLRAQGTVENLQINPTNLGNGSWSLGLQSGIWTASTSLGQIERYLQLNDVAYKPEDKSLSGELVAYDLPFRDLYFAVRPYLTPGESRKTPPPIELPPKLIERLDSVQARLDASLRASGSATNPNLSIDTLELRDIQIRGTPSGRLHAEGSRENDVWNLSTLNWTNGETVMDVKGTIDEHGEISLDGELKNLLTNWMANFEPSFGNMRGRGDFSFLVSGKTKSPEISGSLVATLFEPDKAPTIETATLDTSLPASRNPRLRFETELLTVKDGLIEAQGNFSFLGFKGTADARLPFRYPYTFPEDEPLSASIHLGRRDLKEMKGLIPTLDALRTSGDLWGDLALSGTRSSISIDGRFGIDKGEFALEGYETTVRSLTLDGTLSGQDVALKLSGESSRGGAFTGDAHIALAILGDSLQRSFDALLGSEVSGSLHIQGFKVDEDLGPRGAATFSARGDVKFSGNLKEPLVSTERPLQLRSLSARVPAIFGETGGALSGPVMPRFALEFNVGSAASPGQISAGTGVFEVSGIGNLMGTLVAPQAFADLGIHGGSIRLPNTRIHIDDGGTARLVYRGDPQNPDVRLDVDITGRTSLTALKFNGLTERYDINLQMRGNLMEEGQVQITAQSDPPDLSQEKILAMLGQSELVESLNPQTAGGQLEQRLNTALSYAVPMLLDSFTERFARELGLDFFSVEYNPLEGPTITAAKSLTKNVVIQYRRQISESPDGILHYELRSIYRPFSKKRGLRNFYFSGGTDNFRPWKLTLEYGIRF